LDANLTKRGLGLRDRVVARGPHCGARLVTAARGRQGLRTVRDERPEPASRRPTTISIACRIADRWARPIGSQAAFADSAATGHILWSNIVRWRRPVYDYVSLHDAAE